MSGIFAYIRQNLDGTYQGTTHGCGCCADSGKVTKQEIIDHIQQLEEDLDEARKILAEMER